MTRLLRILRRLFRPRDAWSQLPWASPKPDDREFERLNGEM